MAVARRMTVVAGHPVVPAGRWGAVAYRGPQRRPMVHEVQAGDEEAGYGRTFAGGVLFSGMTTGGGLHPELVDGVNDTPDVRQQSTRGAAKDHPVTGEVAVSAGIWPHPW